MMPIIIISILVNVQNSEYSVYLLTSFLARNPAIQSVFSALGITISFSILCREYIVFLIVPEDVFYKAIIFHVYRAITLISSLGGPIDFTCVSFSR